MKVTILSYVTLVYFCTLVNLPAEKNSYTDNVGLSNIHFHIVIGR